MVGFSVGTKVGTPGAGQRKRTLDASAYEAANAVEIKQGEPFTATWVSNLKS